MNTADMRYSFAPLLTSILLSALVITGASPLFAEEPIAADVCNFAAGLYTSPDNMQACEAYLKTTQVDDGVKAMGYFNLANSYYKHIRLTPNQESDSVALSQYRDAMLMAWNRSLAARPNDLEGLIIRGNFLNLLMQNPNAGAEDFQHAMSLEPQNWKALMGQARVFETQGNGARAVELAQQAVQLAPQESAAHAALARAYVVSGNTAGALTEFDASTKTFEPPTRYAERLITIDPWVELAQLQWSQGNSQQAAETLKRYTKVIEPGLIYASVFIELSYYNEVSGQYAESARAIEDARNANGYIQNGMEVPFRRLVMLVNAQMWPEADEEAQRELPKFGPSKILSIQTALRAEGLKTVQITGKLDPVMEAAVFQCIKSESCFNIFRQQYVRAASTGK